MVKNNVTCVDPFRGDEGHLLDLVSVRVLEVNLCEWGTTTSIMDN